MPEWLEFRYVHRLLSPIVFVCATSLISVPLIHLS